MIRLPKMHSEENKDITPEEKVFLSTLVKMSKVLKIERGIQHHYLPQRLVIQGFVCPSVTDGYLDVTIKAPIKFINLLHPTRTMVQAEYVNMDETAHDPFHFTISLPDVVSSRDWVNDYGYSWDESTVPVTSTSSSVIWSGLSTKNDPQYYTFPPYSTPVNTNTVGFPITDMQYLNNNYINIRVKSMGTSVTLTYPRLDLTLVFYAYSGNLHE